MSRNHDVMRTERNLTRFRQMSILELLTLKTDTAWRVDTIEGQIHDPKNDEKGDEWRRDAKLALNYSRRELGLINNVLAEKRTERDEERRVVGGAAMIKVLQSLMELYEIAQIFRQDDSDEAWERLEQALDKCDEIQLSS